MQVAIVILEVLGVLAVLFVLAAVAFRDDEVLVDVPPDDPDLDLPFGQLQPEDIRRVRFPMVVRGYRMREVDAVLARVATELADRDARLLSLEEALVDVVEPATEEPVLSSPAEDLEPLEDDVRTPAEVLAPDPEPAPDEARLPAPAELETGLAGMTITSGALTAVTPPSDVAPAEPVAQEQPVEPLASEEPAPVPLDPTSLVPQPLREPVEHVRLWPQPDLEDEPEPLSLTDEPEPQPEPEQDPLTAPIDDAAFSGDFPEVLRADDQPPS